MDLWSTCSTGGTRTDLWTKWSTGGTRMDLVTNWSPGEFGKTWWKIFHQVNSARPAAQLCRRLVRFALRAGNGVK